MLLLVYLFIIILLYLLGLIHRTSVRLNSGSTFIFFTHRSAFIDLDVSVRSKSHTVWKIVISANPCCSVLREGRGDIFDQIRLKIYRFTDSVDFDMASKFYLTSQSTSSSPGLHCFTCPAGWYLNKLVFFVIYLIYFKVSGAALLTPLRHFCYIKNLTLVEGVKSPSFYTPLSSVYYRRNADGTQIISLFWFSLRILTQTSYLGLADVQLSQVGVGAGGGPLTGVDVVEIWDK